jgi:hypothetical protein
MYEEFIRDFVLPKVYAMAWASFSNHHGQCRDLLKLSLFYF